MARTVGLGWSIVRKFTYIRSYIQTYIDYYLHAWTHYRERFVILIEILYNEDTKPFFRTYIYAGLML